MPEILWKNMKCTVVRMLLGLDYLDMVMRWHRAVTEEIPYHKDALSMADLEMIPEGAYRNRKYASEGVSKTKKINRALEDILYDPQTSGGLMIAVSENDAKNLLVDLLITIPCA